ncbi:hypothetical protein [Amorphus coralli]|uniref:hypothetical protein n=1 Tax=Amorphus coralli TaxID=340680 RepID=UPI00035C21D0|nr:hypothetical protein [Amorphus coralli]
MVTIFSNVRTVSSFALAATLAALALSGCSSQPGAPLLGAKSAPPIPAPATDNPVRADGYPNPLVDPVTIDGTPLTAAEQAQLQTDLETQRVSAQARSSF